MRCFARLMIVALALSLAPPTASANGRFPRSVKVIFQPGHPEHIVLATTFGLLQSNDDGATWRWICESAIGFAGTYDPDYEISPTGAIFANTTATGMVVTHDGCHWNPVPGAVGTTPVTAIAIGPDGAIWAGTSDSIAGSAIWKSTDDGVTFTQTAMVGITGDWWASIEVAPSDAQRVIVTAFRMANGQPRERLLFRSSDGGTSWSPLPTTGLVGTNNSDLLIAGVSAVDPNRVFIRVTIAGPALEETIYRTDNFWTADVAGPTWIKVLDVLDTIPGFAIRDNGDVYAATPSQGLWRSTDGGLTFAVVAGVIYEGRCLSERSDHQLWMCSNNLPPDAATMQVSTTGAVGTWTRRLAYADITGPVRCGNDTVQYNDCEALLWCGLRENLGITSNEIDCPPPAVDAGVDARGGGGGNDKSCCSTGGGPGLEVAVIGLGLVARRRRRRATR
jgi:hypothetical protein